MNQPNGSNVSVTRLILVLVPVVLIIVAGFVFMTMFGGLDAINNMQPPPPVVVSGTVTVDGKPLGQGKIQTQPVDAQLAGSVAELQADGSFQLQLAEGQLGAHIGEHKVAIVAPKPEGGDGLLTPPAYADLATTPLMLYVSKNTDLNKWNIQLTTTGDETKVIASAGGATPVPTGGGRAMGGAVGPEVIAHRTVESYDQDKDGKLHGAELEEALGFLSSMVSEPDGDGDGYVTEAELLAAMLRYRAGGGAPAEPPGATPPSAEQPAAPGGEPPPAPAPENPPADSPPPAERK